MLILLCFAQLTHVGFCLNMPVSSSLVSTIMVAMGAYVRVGWRFRNRGEVLLGYGRVSFVAFKYKHCLTKIALCTFNICIIVSSDS